MIFDLSFDEALSILVAAVAVKTRYEIEEDIRSPAYLALKSGVEKLELQLWEER